MHQVPNLLTALRLLLVPAIAALLLDERYIAALVCFGTSAASDLLDGMIARRWNARTTLGAVLDPVADKLTMVTVATALWYLGHLPAWLAVAIASRDMLIVSGVAVYRCFVGPLRMAPRPASKFNTAFEFVTLLGALAAGAAVVPAGPWLHTLVAVTGVTIAWSAVDYLVIGMRMVRGTAAI